jgi:hypothetical protein
MATRSLRRCIKEARVEFPFAAPTGKSLRTFILPIFSQIILDCPKDLRPRFNSQDSVWNFKNKSRIRLGGTDNGHEESLRGPKADEAAVEEAGFVECSLRYLVEDILKPQLLYASSPPCLCLVSTPPLSPAHEYVGYLASAEAKGNLITKTIWDNPRLRLEEVLLIAEEAGCVIDWTKKEIIHESTTWKREYLAQVVTDSNSAIVPEFQDKASAIVKEWPRPQFFHRYVVIDTGFIDLTAALFFYHDFRRAKFVFEDEVVIERPTSKDIAEACFRKERELWGEAKPYARWADGDLIVLQDLSSLHGYHVTPVSKDELEAQVNQARLDVLHESIVIDPRCKHLISHTKYGIWDKNRRKFERSEGLGHFDALMAMIYGLRHVNRNINPWPANLGISEYTHFIKEKQNISSLEKAFIGR